MKKVLYTFLGILLISSFSVANSIDKPKGDIYTEDSFCTSNNENMEKYKPISGIAKKIIDDNTAEIKITSRKMKGYRLIVNLTSSKLIQGEKIRLYLNDEEKTVCLEKYIKNWKGKKK
ncbi:hypothetical protein [Persephonella sp.]